MPYGIEIFAPDGKLIMDGSGRYARIIDIFDPYTTGVPGSKSFPSFSPEDIQAIVTQGRQRVLTVTQSGSTFFWEYADSYTWPEFAGDARITVFIR
jgi:hypothetical protein